MEKHTERSLTELNLQEMCEIKGGDTSSLMKTESDTLKSSINNIR